MRETIHLPRYAVDVHKRSLHSSQLEVAPAATADTYIGAIYISQAHTYRGSGSFTVLHWKLKVLRKMVQRDVTGHTARLYHYARCFTVINCYLNSPKQKLNLNSPSKTHCFKSIYIYFNFVICIISTIPLIVPFIRIEKIKFCYNFQEILLSNFLQL